MVKQKKSYTEARKIFYDDNKGNEPFIFRKENFPEMPLSKTHNNTQRYEIPKNNIDSKKYEEVIHVLKQKDTFIQLTAQIISNLYDVGNPAKTDSELIKLLDIYRKHPEIIQKFTNF